jgi:hypothetical protein
LYGPKRKVTKEKGPLEEMAAAERDEGLATARRSSGFLCRFEIYIRCDRPGRLLSENPQKPRHRRCGESKSNTCVKKVNHDESPLPAGFQILRIR